MPKCDVQGCPTPDKEFRSPAGLGSHKFRAHGIGGSSRTAKASLPEGESGKPRKIKRRKIRRVPAAPESPAGRNGPSGARAFVQTLLDEAEGHEKKAQRLRALAAELEEELQSLF